MYEAATLRLRCLVAVGHRSPQTPGRYLKSAGISTRCQCMKIQYETDVSTRSRKINRARCLKAGRDGRAETSDVCAVRLEVCLGYALCNAGFNA